MNNFKALYRKQGLPMKNIRWVGNLVSPMASIEERAESLAKNISALDLTKVHLVAHSFTGVDARAALSLRNDLQKHVASLTTICTPHHGMKLVDKSRALPRKYGDLEQLEKAFEILGMSKTNVQEFCSENMEAFN